VEADSEVEADAEAATCGRQLLGGQWTRTRGATAMRQGHRLRAGPHLPCATHMLPGGHGINDFLMACHHQGTSIAANLHCNGVVEDTPEVDSDGVAAAEHGGGACGTGQRGRAANRSPPFMSPRRLHSGYEGTHCCGLGHVLLLLLLAIQQQGDASARKRFASDLARGKGPGCEPQLHPNGHPFPMWSIQWPSATEPMASAPWPYLPSRIPGTGPRAAAAGEKGGRGGGGGGAYMAMLRASATAMGMGKRMGIPKQTPIL
jgi:hypothetical protein